MKVKRYLAIVGFLLLIIQISAQERFVFKGRVVDFVTVQPLENACVHNMSSGMMTFSDKQGNYAIRIKQNDTLAITRVGFEMEVIVATDSVIQLKNNYFIRLVMKSIMLKNFTVYAMKPYPLFVKDLAKKTPKEKVEIDVNLSEEEKAQYSKKSESGNLLANTPLASPITFLYEKFSRKAKLDKTYQEMVKNQDEVIRLSQKYNREIVQRITNLQGTELDEFMLYCAFSYYTLAISSEVEIEKMISKKFIEYKKGVTNR